MSDAPASDPPNERPSYYDMVRYHITLWGYDRKALAYMRAHYGFTTRSAAIRACIRAAAVQVGFAPPPPGEE
jgi:hypothetical protein